jgi:hypothetical protein
MVRVLQWVALAGDDAVVLRINSSFLAVAMAGFRPGRAASFSKPANPAIKKRFRHRAAFLLLMRRLAAIYRSVFPSAGSSTTLERSTWRADRVRDLAHCLKVFFCESSITTAGATRIGMPPQL